MLRELDIIIINYNSTDLLLICLESIYKNYNKDNICIWVWDNNSNDNPGRIRARFPHVYLNENNRNIGFAAAVNRGLEWSRAPYVMLLNPDTEIKKKVIDVLLIQMKCQKNLGVLGPKILNPDGSLQQSARAFPNLFTGIYGRTSILTKIFPKNRMTQKNLLATSVNGKTPIEVDWISGACMLVRKEAIQNVGFLDERFYMYWEDADWCRRMREKGWRVVYNPVISVLHSVGKSSQSHPIRSSLEFHKSAYFLYAKYAAGKQLLLLPIVFGALIFRFYILSTYTILKRFF